ncbi:protein kinase [Myxococcaceae bacterium GXIMD 01537]
MSALRVGPPSGTLLDGWNLVTELGNGGFAIVYLGEKNGRQAALKVARHREASGDDKRTHARLLRELTALLMLEHPNIIRHQGYGYAESGNVYLALAYVEGWTLAQWKERKHPTVREILCVFEKLAAALSYMHRRGVLHRDLKLTNVLIRKSDGEPILIDLSCATYTLAEELTDGGLPPGTDRFRAPEQFTFLREHRDEHQARYAFQVADEIFALGAMLYELLTDPRPTELRHRASLNFPQSKPPSARSLNPRVPEALSDLVETLLSHDPARRPADTEALRRELAELLEDPGAEYGVPAHPPSEQLNPEPTERAAPATLQSPRARGERTARGGVMDRIRRSGRGLAVGAAVVLSLVGAVAVWRYSGVVPAPPGEPRVGARPPPPSAPHSSPLVTPAPGMSPTGPVLVDAPGPAIAAVQKEGSTVKTPPPEVSTEGRPPPRQKKTLMAAECAKLSLVAALAAGCPGAQLRPEPFTCPDDTVRTMSKDLHWSGRRSFTVRLDERNPSYNDMWFTPGAEIVSVTPEGFPDPEQNAMAPAGTRFFGRVYYLPETLGREEGPALIVKYDRVKLPGQEEQPICAVANNDIATFEGGRVLARNVGNARLVGGRWP